MVCPRPLQRRSTDTHSQNTRRWATTQRGCPCRRRQRRLSRHPPTREAVGLLALINHTVRRGWERKIRLASTGRRRARRDDAGRKSPLLGGEKRRATSRPPFFFFPWVRTSRPSSAPTRFGERETEEPGAGSLGVCHRLASAAAEVAQIALRDR